MKKIILLIIFLFLPININAYAEAYVVMDADSGRVLGGNKEYDSYLIASTTNIMTT